jgi:hypothetical protein
VAYFSSGWPIAYLVATVVFAAGLVIGAIVHVSQPGQYVGPSRSLEAPNPQSPIPNSSSIVARITGTVDCVWEGAGDRVQGSGAASQKSDITNPKSPIRLGDRLALRSGLLEITYDTGARVILQGPVTYEVESSTGGYLSIGRLTAKLAKKSEVRGQKSESARQKSSDLRPLASGLFAIRTPTAIVTDLGTEFGVEVSGSGSTTSHVYRGLVRLQPIDRDGQTGRDATVLRENESARVEDSSDPRGIRQIKMLGPSSQPANFVREIPRQNFKYAIKALDLVDVVAGGNGLGKARDCGIDPLTGNTSARQPNNLDQSSDGRYHKVVGRPLVDGVFIPHAAAGPVQLDSAGHVFTGFSTANGGSWSYIWAGGVWPADPGRILPTSLVGGLDYSQPWHSMLGMHANKGITFDLEAIRRANPRCKLMRFSAAAGRALYGNAESGGDPGKADVWVFVDGQLRFRREKITAQDGELKVVIPLDDQNRFLTLVATDGGDETFADLVIFGDPKLILAEYSEAAQ